MNGDPPTEKSERRKQSDGTHPDELHDEVSDDGAVDAKYVAHWRIRGVVQAGIVDGPGGQGSAQRYGCGYDHNADKLLQPTLQEKPRGFGQEVSEGKGRRAHEPWVCPRAFREAFSITSAG